MSTKIVLLPFELGKVAYNEVRGHQPLLDKEFVDNYLTDDYTSTEQFRHMQEWFRGYKQASYDLYDEQKRKEKKAKNSAIGQFKTIEVNEDALPF